MKLLKLIKKAVYFFFDKQYFHGSIKLDEFRSVEVATVAQPTLKSHWTELPLLIYIKLDLKVNLKVELQNDNKDVFDFWI